MKENTYWRRVAAGLCPMCGGPRDGNALKCSACTAYTNEQRRIRRKSRIDRGICVRCEKAPARPGRTMCAECAEKEAARKKAAYLRERNLIK